MAHSDSRDMTRPQVMESLSETQLSELENQYDQNDRDEFDIVAGSFGWDMDTCQSVWDWFSTGERNEGFEGKDR